MRRSAVLVVALVLGASAGAGCRIAAHDTYALRTSGTIPPAAYEHYIRGRMAAIEGDHRKAIAELRLAAAVAPQQAELRVAIAEELLAAGMTEHAKQEIKIVLDKWRDDPKAWKVAGRIFARSGDLERSIAAYGRAVALDAADEESWLLLAAGHRAKGDVAAVEKTYLRLLEQVPYSAEGHFRLGRSLLVRKQLDDAATHLARAVQLEPAHIDARVALAEVHRRRGDAKLAGETLREAFERSGDDPSVGERLFRVHLEAGDQESALALVKTLDADWREPSVRVALGYLYLQLRKHPEALAVADSLLRRDAGLDAARVLKARGLAQARRYADAIAVLREIASGSDDYVDARALAGELAARDGRPKDGLVLVEEAAAAWPDDTTLVATRSSLYEKLGDVAKARAILAEAQAKRPESEDLIYARASLEERAGDVERAVAIMTALLDEDADSVLALNFIGYLYANRGEKLDEAERLLRRAVELRPDDGYVLDSWGWYLVQRGRYTEAREALERADRLSPFEPEILLHLGELYVRAGDADRARSTFERALALDPDDRVRVRLEEGMRSASAPNR